MQSSDNAFVLKPSSVKDLNGRHGWIVEEARGPRSRRDGPPPARGGSIPCRIQQQLETFPCEKLSRLLVLMGRIRAQLRNLDTALILLR